MSDHAPVLLPRRIADAYVDALIRLDPLTGSYLGDTASNSRLPDLSPAGQDAVAHLMRDTLDELTAAESAPGADDPAELRCGRLLRERLTSELAVRDAGEGLRSVSNIHSPVHGIREAFSVMPTETESDWRAFESRFRALPAALAGYRSSLALGLERGLPAGPRATGAFMRQLGIWIGSDPDWLGGLVQNAPSELRAVLEDALVPARAALTELHAWMRDVYAPAVAHAPDVVGRERYALLARFFTGATLDLDEAYAYGWSEYHRLLGEMKAEAEKILPGSTPWEALSYADEHGEVLEGVETTRVWLQNLMDEAIEQLDGEHFDLAPALRVIESRIAPPGSSAAPFYTAPSEDFSRPGRTWLPTLGSTRFPTHQLVSTWYHEGVPGHHLQLAQWVHVSDRLSRYQATIGQVDANAEGWALYAERLMDELGYLTRPERRLGYLDAQMMRACRVIIDIGMHLELEIPADSPFAPGLRWTPDRAEQFFAAHSGKGREFVESELTRYLCMAGQAIGYKLGERAWLRGREAARAAHGAGFDMKAWHMAALSQGSLGLDDLVAELSKL
ncbi:DUF885 domain-containing protein [Streptomyces sp. NPDC088757]|uniref:DUF885 domain-containing protein n=1 Tax=Streptomyces sp. NPDC088757 TaxID=3365889 RepID=UPI00380A48B2